MADEQANDPVYTELRRYETTGEILPGSAESLAAAWRSQLGGLPAPRLAEEVRKRLDSGLGSRHRDPEFPGFRRDDGTPPSPCRIELMRRADMLRDGAVDALAKSLGAQLNHLPAPRIAAEVVSRLSRRDMNAYLRNPIPPPHGEIVVASRLHDHFPEIKNCTATAYAWRNDDLDRLDEAQFVRTVARRLTLGAAAKGHTRGDLTLAGDDERLTYSRPAGEPAKPDTGNVKFRL
jgi:hypothetical protein